MSSYNPSPPRPPSIVDVAREAGVSSMTVSRVLRGERTVRSATADKVMAAVERLGYRRNPLVQTLMTSVRRRRVGREANLAWIAVPRSYDSPEIQMRALRQKEGAQVRAASFGFGFEEILLDDPALTRERLRKILRARGVMGIIVAPLKEAGTSLSIPWEEYAVSTIGRSLKTPLISHAMLHHHHAMSRTLDEVASRGYRRIAFIYNQDSQERCENMHLMLFHFFNLSRAPKNRLEPIDFEHWTDEQVCEWLYATKPDAVVTTYPNQAARVRRQGLSFMEAVGYATISARRAVPDLAGIRQPMAELGATAVDIVVNLIHRNERGVPSQARSVLVEGRWQEGQSLRPSKVDQVSE